MDKTMYLLRGLPGAGKSTLAKVLGRGAVTAHFEADMYFYTEVGTDPTKYDFDASKLHAAHKWCQDSVESWISGSSQPIIVSNTFTTEKELKPYYDLAKKYGYKVVSLVVENRNGGQNIHNVPEETLDKMEKRFTVKLR